MYVYRSLLLECVHTRENGVDTQVWKGGGQGCGGGGEIRSGPE